MGKKLHTASGRRFILLSLVMWCVTILFLAPFYVLIIYAFKPREATMLKNPLAFPDTLYLQNFVEAVQKSDFLRAFTNSTVSTVCGVVVLVLICSMAAYIVVRRGNNRFYGVWQYIFLASVMLPFQTIMFPLYKNLMNLHLLNSRPAYVLVSVGFQMGFDIFLYCGFIKTVPVELEEAAAIDGCSRMGIFWRIVFPLLKPVTMTVVVLSALGIWNDYLMSSLFLTDEVKRTLALTIRVFVNEYSVDYAPMLAGLFLSMIPMLIFYVLCQKHILEGVVQGSVKG